MGPSELGRAASSSTCAWTRHSWWACLMIQKRTALQRAIGVWSNALRVECAALVGHDMHTVSCMP